MAVVSILLPPEELDVNIHPTKSEVKFRSEHAVFSAVHRAVRQALETQITVPEVKAAKETVFSSPPTQAVLPHVSDAAYSPPPSPPTPVLPVLRVIGQLDNSYIIAEGPDGLYLIDQHAAHERVLFERVQNQRLQKEIEVQGLLEPMTLEVSPRQEAVLRAHCGDMSEFGFTIESFGERTFLVRAVPLLLSNKDWVGMVKELLDSVAGGNKEDWEEGVARSLACHSAVRAGQALTDTEMQELVRQLEQSAAPHTCPHGRPTMIHLSSGQLKREFGRT
jgi:DNA mismatch repair protein MutL